MTLYFIWTELTKLITLLIYEVMYKLHWHYNPPCVLTSDTILQLAPLSAANSLHLLNPCLLSSSYTTSFQLFVGHPSGLLAHGTLSNNLFTCLKLSIICMWSIHLIRWALMKFIIFSPFINSISSTFMAPPHNFYQYWITNLLQYLSFK